MKPDSTPTMKDVARESGYSLATVSKVINGLPTGQKSRERVEAAIKKLGYHVNTYARALKSSKTYNIVIVMPSLKHPFFAHLTDELIRALGKLGYTHRLMLTDYDPEAERKSFSMVRANKSDGIIALTYSSDLEVDDSIPIVTIDRHLGETIPCISSDNYRGGEIAANKLAELGCRKLLFIRITSSVQGEPAKRRDGFEKACEVNGVDFESLLLLLQETEEPIFRFLEERVCGEEPEFDGIFCNSDELACKVARFLREHGVDIPGQVQIIGYDGLKDHFTNDYVCSTIEQPLSQMAQAAVDFLLTPNEIIAGTNICLPVKYVSAGTTKD